MGTNYGEEEKWVPKARCSPCPSCLGVCRSALRKADRLGTPIWGEQGRRHWTCPSSSCVQLPTGSHRALDKPCTSPRNRRITCSYFCFLCINIKTPRRSGLNVVGAQVPKTVKVIASSQDLLPEPDASILGGI